MESDVKYENFEVYEEPTAETSSTPTMSQMPDNCAPNFNVSTLKRNYNEANEAALDNFHASICQISGQIPAQYSNFYAPQQPSNRARDTWPMKRYRRGESSTLFGPPFFQLQTDYDAINSGETITARCLTCQVVLRGHKNVSSNFIKHMKRQHPEVHKIYENIKLFKHRDITANEAVMNVRNIMASEEDPACFDSNPFLAQTTTITPGYEEHNSETTDNNSTTPPNTTDVSDLPENSDETVEQPQQEQQQHQQQQTQLQECAKVDLSNRTLSMMSSMLDQKLKAFVTRDELAETKQTFNNLVQQNTPTVPPVSSTKTDVQSSSLQAQLDALQKECEALRQLVKQSQRSKQQLRSELQTMDRELRRHKLVIRNINIENTEKPHAAVDKFLKECLGLTTISLKKTQIIARNPRNQQSNKHNVLIELADDSDARAILRNCFKLKNTGMFVEHSMSHHARKRKEKLIVLRKELRRRNGNIRVFLRQSEMIIEGKKFYWDEVDGLCLVVTDGSSVDGTEDALQCLKELTGIDLSEFLSVLKNYKMF